MRMSEHGKRCRLPLLERNRILASPYLQEAGATTIRAFIESKAATSDNSFYPVILRADPHPPVADVTAASAEAIPAPVFQPNPA